MTVAQAPKEWVIEWYCRHCWQEGSVTFQGGTPPLGWPDPAKIPAVLKQHAAILSNFINPGICRGDIHPQQSKSVMKRVRRMKPPPLPDEGAPVVITKRGTPHERGDEGTD